MPEGITVYENPRATSVSNLMIDRTIQGITYFSGYEANYNYAGHNWALFTNELTVDIPTVSWNSNCYHASPYKCEMSMWAGLSNSYGGGGFLLQSGVDISVPCTSSTLCGSTVYTSWYEWVPYNAATPCGSSYPVYAFDQVTPFEENGGFSGGNGNSNDYQAFVEDPTQSWVCGSGWYDIASTAYYAQSIIETPSNGCCPIPTSWGTWDIYQNILCPGTTSSTCVSWYYAHTNADVMNNYCTALGYYVDNIIVGGSFNTLGTYTQQYNNNCDF